MFYYCLEIINIFCIINKKNVVKEDMKLLFFWVFCFVNLVNDCIDIRKCNLLCQYLYIIIMVNDLKNGCLNKKIKLYFLSVG